MGVSRPEIGSTLRSFPFGNYVVFCCPMKVGIDVVRVLWGGRDIVPLF